MTLPVRTLGRTGFAASVLGFGAMELRGLPQVPDMTDADAAALLNAVLDCGINLIDTSIDYGRSEELIGRHISARRDEYFLASKCGCPLDPDPNAPQPYPHDFTPQNVRAGLEQSLRRLRTDHLDLLQVHLSPSRAQLEADGTIETMLALRDEGKIRFLGMSGTLPNLPDHIEMGVFDAFQIPYSALQREHDELITRAAAAGAGTLIRGGAARGAPAEDKGWSVNPIGAQAGEAERRWRESGVEELLDGMPRIEFVLRFTLSHPDLHTTIVGTANPAHLQRNVEIASKGSLPPDLYAEARRRIDAVGRIGGYGSQPR
jgi:aryl-alcohol dehydrogenase-like predicted oxidoreductase